MAEFHVMALVGGRIAGASWLPARPRGTCERPSGPSYHLPMTTSNGYPEKTCSIDRLVRHKKLVAATLEGKKTEQRRDGVYGYPGETFELEGQGFEIVSLSHERLGDMTEASAHAEGYATLDDYRDLILRMHKGMEWDVEHLVWVHRFRRIE